MAPVDGSGCCFCVIAGAKMLWILMLMLTLLVLPVAPPHVLLLRPAR